MDTIIEGPQDEKGQLQDISIIDTTGWTSQAEQIVNNSTLLYIAVEYVKDYKVVDPNTPVTSQNEVYSEFDSHVSPLDPNMGSVANYSPVYNDSPAEYNPVVIHQLVTQDGAVQNEQFISSLNTSSIDTIPTVLCNNDVRGVSSDYLQMVNSNETNIVTTSNSETLEQKVELLITDETTGISYSVDAQELLVEPCLQDEHQLLESLAPDPILESDLLTLDDRTLKSELNDNLDVCPNDIATVNTEAVNNYINNLSEANESPRLNSYKMVTRPKRNGVDSEDNILSCVYSIIDKPILTRARASLPESYLVLGKATEEDAVFAKKVIPKRTQFGPLEGVLVPADISKLEEDKLVFFIEIDGGLYKIDTNDENNSNWMMFVRQATTFEEQNLIITQENNCIYFTSTTTIMPKQELKVWYSSLYAQYYDLPTFQPIKELSWHCYECPTKFETSEELQIHLDTHDTVKDENIKPRKKKYFHKKIQNDTVECQICHEMFFQYNYNFLKLHINQKHQLPKGTVEEYFTIVNNFKCDKCTSTFRSESLLKIHSYKHNPDTSEEQTNHVCPDCQKKFPGQSQLVLHVMQHAILIKPQPKKYKCSICYSIFSKPERLQKHMVVHGSDDNKPLQCKTCNKRFLTNSALSCHLKTHFIGKKAFECPICKETFDHVLKLKLHVPSHCQNNSFTCPHCNKIFKKYSIIRKHIRAFHCERIHECTNCTKVFPTLDKLRMHLLKHSDHREFLCANCGKQFKRKDKLKEHCKRIHSEERENTIPQDKNTKQIKKCMPKVEPTDFHRFIYKCHSCMVGFKRRGMLVNHLAKRHPDIRPESVPELNLPILQTTRDYYCQYCEKVYKSSSKRKAHILKNHPGAALPPSNRKQGSLQEVSGLPNPTFSQTVGSITTRPQNCKWCHKQYASKAKLLQHQRKKHRELLISEEVKDIPQNNNGIELMNEKIDQKRDDNDAVTEFDKVVENMISGELDYNLEEEGEYCHLAINENESFIETNELENPNSHLYRLLTTANNGMLPPR
ncbi:PR domain zinc finger protein 10-like [Diorhabda carinulata]|uniref:PR domain zinc finger protein 10-like n=1 Tax=Diorhabda carinulata TaxID=1163345 RepID=UPI0025A274D9|nr:PR domain zinc finger protein 10-like [Diorhabda carinulata]